MSLQRLCATLIVCLPNLALAGAWPAPEGVGQYIVTTSLKGEDPGDLAKVLSDEDARNEISLYGEYGLTEDTTGGLTVYAGFDQADLRYAEVEIGAFVRHRFWQDEAGDVASFEAGFSLPAERWIGSGLGDNRDNSVNEIYMSLMYGMSGQLDWANVFASSGMEYRARGSGKADEVTLFTTLGFQPHDRFIALLDIWLQKPLDRDDRLRLKLTPSVGLILKPWMWENEKKSGQLAYPTTLQFGVTYDTLNSQDGVALNLSIWRSF